MSLETISGPGVGDWLTDRMKEWGISELTDVQSRSLDAGIADGQSMIVCAPTSSGKTLVGEVAVLAALRKNMRALYLVSHKALADQKYSDFIERYGEDALEPLASVGLNTGDRAEGDVNAQLTVATYEKALGLVLAGQLNPSNALIVADELQILGDPNRGPDIEALCAVFRQRGVGQFVALTATVENPEDIAAWMNCRLVVSTCRDIPLQQEVWFEKRIFRTTFGQEDGQEIEGDFVPADNVIGVVGQLLDLGRGPVLVFTESRREAADSADAFGKNRPRVGAGVALAEQLDLFSEPTESSERLRENAERRVIFHTADLSPQERQVIETAFSTAGFEACFATSTLAAGVNYPFRTVVFPKLTYQYGERAGRQIPRSEYRNMSGRAGRLGMHPDGYAVLLPRNKVELSHANKLVLPENDRADSQLVNLSIRKTILMLVASRLASNLEEVMTFFHNSLYWYQILNGNPAKLAKLETDSQSAIKWLIEVKLLRDVDSTILVTPLGQAAAVSGLLPATAVRLASMLTGAIPGLSKSFDEGIPGLIYAVCASDEFRGDRPSRFFPFVQTSHDSIIYWADQALPLPFERADNQLAQCAQAMVLYVEGLAERKIAYQTKVGTGAVHRLAIDVSWVLEGLHKISCVPEVSCPQAVSNHIALLARQVRWGAPAEALDIMRVAERNSVPGLGRQRAMTLVAQGIKTLHDILATTKENLTRLLRNDRRAEALLSAASSSVGLGRNRLEGAHIRTATDLGIEHLVEATYQKLDTAYETAVEDLLRVETSWVVTVLDDGKRQNVPDILIQLGQIQILLECKTCTKSPPLIKKEDAWAVLQKAADFGKEMARVTLGKPVFDEVSKKKAATATDITLLEHHAFVEGILRVHAGSLTPKDFLTWIATPGVSEIERLGGKPTFSA